MDAEVSRLKFAREVDALRAQATDFVANRGWEIVSSDYPVFDVVLTHPTSKRRVGFRFLCDDWDERPPSLSLFDPETLAELSWERWPQGGWSALNPHPTTGKPFLCLPGIREYHTHSSHLQEPWAGLRSRETYKLRYIVHRVHERFNVTQG